MNRHVLRSSALATIFAFGLSMTAFAQTTVRQAPNYAGQFKEIGKTVGDATKEAGKQTAKGTKKVAKKTGEVTTDAAKATKDVFTPGKTYVSCKDGTMQRGTTRFSACEGHGGVK